MALEPQTPPTRTADGPPRWPLVVAGLVLAAWIIILLALAWTSRFSP